MRRREEEEKRRREKEEEIRVWNISFVWKLILVGLELVWNFWLEFMFGLVNFQPPSFSICRLGKP